MGRRVNGYEMADSLNDYSPIQAEAAALKRQFEERLRDIRAQKSLSLEGKRTMVARAWQEFKPAFDRFQAREQADYASALRSRQHELVGLRNRDDAGAVVSFRDAMDRAEALPRGGLSGTEQEQLRTAAENLLRRAELGGDEIQARAVLCVAIDRGISSVVDTYKRDNPDQADLIDGYQELRRFDPETSQLASYLWKVQRPQEIGTLGMDEAGIAALAAQDVYGIPESAVSSARLVTHADRSAWGFAPES